MGKRSRVKGVAFEREIASLLRDRVPHAGAKRTLHETREGNSGDIENTLGWVIQCKVGACPPVYQAFAEAVAAQRKQGAGVPIAVVRRNRGAGRPCETLAVLRLDDFLTLVGGTV